MLEKYYRINQAVGVSIHLLNDGHMQISACEVAVESNKLNFGKKSIALAGVEALKKHFPTKFFVALDLTGKGILQKQLERLEQIDQNNFSKILPNGNIADFYVQNFLSGEYSFVSIIRKTEADKWITQLNELGLVPLQLSLGPFPVQHIIPQLNIYDKDLVFDGHVISLNRQSDWDTYQYDETALAPFPLKVESENIREQLLIPYAAAFQLILASKVQLITADVPLLENEFNALIATKKLKAIGALILCVFFVLLLANFLVFSALTTLNTKLAEQVSRSAQSYTDIQGIKDTIRQKEMLLRDLGWEGGINKSALVDQLASLLPQEITCKEISVNPVDAATSRVQKSIAFFNRQIKITGNAENIIPVNEWIARVKTKPWVKNIQLDSYAFNNELNTGQFTVIINY